MGNKTYGIASMVCGILSLLCCCCNEWFGIGLGVIAIVLFVLEKVFVKSSSGFAIAGLICGIISVVISILGLILVEAIMSMFPEIEEMYSSILGEYSEF